jgi:two-component SAPR family response regulator
MEELRDAVRMLAEEAQQVANEMQAMDDVPSPAQLEALQKAVDRVQRGLNRMQTAMDSWTETKEEV